VKESANFSMIPKKRIFVGRAQEMLKDRFFSGFPERG